LSEEFGDWDESRRRIDLLAIDSQANLVVIELKRTSDSGHMELQAIHQWLGASSGIRGLGFNYAVNQEEAKVELYVDRGQVSENKRIFDELQSHKAEIEVTFGSELIWERLEGKRACRIKKVIGIGGYRSPETLWPAIQAEMVKAMTSLEHALQAPLDALEL